MPTSLKPEFNRKLIPTYIFFKMSHFSDIKVKDEEENFECKVANGDPDTVKLEEGTDSICGPESAVPDAMMIKMEPLDICNNALLCRNTEPADTLQGTKDIKEEGIDFDDSSNPSVSRFVWSCSAESGSDDGDTKDEQKAKQLKTDESETDDEKPFKCQVCDYRSNHRGHLRRHTVAKHSIEKPFLCPHCQYRSSIKKSLEEHIMSRHTGERRYQCDQCPHKSVRKQDLQRHVSSVHTNLRRFSCDFCDYCCNNKNNMDIHTTARHSMEKPFSCPHCDYKSAWKKGMERHIMFKHTGEKPFQCSDCLRRFTKKEGLKRHILAKHKGEKNYLCSYCKYSCVGRYGLNKHIRRMHKCAKIPHDLREFLGIPPSPQRLDLSDVDDSGDVK